MTAALHNATPRRRLELIDGASAALRQLSPRPCGRERCPVDCEPCLRAWALGVLWLSKLPGAPEPPQISIVRAPLRATVEEPVPPQVAAARLRERRLGSREAS